MTGKEKIDLTIKIISKKYQELIIGNVIIIKSNELSFLDIAEQKQILDLFIVKKYIKYTSNNDDEYSIVILDKLIKLISEDSEINNITILHANFTNIVNIIDLLTTKNIGNIINNEELSELNNIYTSLLNDTDRILGKTEFNELNENKCELYKTLYDFESIDIGWEFDRVEVYNFLADLDNVKQSLSETVVSEKTIKNINNKITETEKASNNYIDSLRIANEKYREIKEFRAWKLESNKNKVIYELSFKMSGELLINNTVIKQTRAGLVPDILLFEAFKNKNKEIRTPNLGTRSISAVLSDVGISGNIKKMFFPKASKNIVLLRPCITQQIINNEKIDTKEIDDYIRKLT